MAETEPSITDIKLLFARSGNRCAFPRCAAPMAYNDTLLGEICHIKGKKPNSARYDPLQTPSQRHHYDNLILLCPNHHAVVDDDTDSYTVERLQRMKATHEAQATPISDANAQCVAANYVSIRTIGQAGGIAAQNVNATNITLNSGPVVEPVTQKRQLQALETLWQIVRNLSQEFSQVIFIDSILLANELDDYFRNRPTDSMVNVLCDFEDLSCAPTKLVRAGDYTKERPFVKNRIWSIVFVISAVYGRAGLLITNSYKKNTYQDWRKDSGIDQLLRSILPSNIVQQIQDKKFAGLRTAIDHLENQLLIEAGMQNG